MTTRSPPDRLGWLRARSRPDVKARLSELALNRTRDVLPIVLVVMVIGLGVSPATGIPISSPIVLINIGVIGVAVAGLYLIRRGRVPVAYGHAVCALAWVLPAITTLSSMHLIGAPMLTLVLMLELVALALILSTWWALAVSVPVVVVGLPPIAAAGPELMILAVVGVWGVGIVVQIALQRYLILAELQRLDLQRALDNLQHELEERRRAEAERERLRDQFVHAQRMEAVGTMSAGLAHDMNNILGGILGYAELLRDEVEDTQIRDDVEQIRKEAERGAALTRSLLAFARKGTYRRGPIALSEVIDDVMPLLARSVGKRVQIERRDGEHGAVDGDPAQLGQIVINLCLNAADAMSEGGIIVIETDVVALDDRAIASLPAGRYARLAVTDSGIGMDETTRQRIFEPFFTTKPPGKGTGLGLAMVYGAVQTHGGELAVHSSPGAGTRIEVYLPITTAAAEPEVDAPETSLARGGTVLIIDDEPALRRSTARIVDRLGLTAVTANDGAEGLAVYDEHRGDIVLVLLDLVMPTMRGEECFHRLRERGAPPVLLLSGYSDNAVVQGLLAAGARGFIEKPVTAAQLAAEIDRALRRRSGVHQAAH